MARKLLFLLPIILLFGCQDRFGSSDDQGSVRAVFRTDSLLSVVSKAATIVAPAADQFSFRVENTRGEVLRTWASITEVPPLLNLVTGSYRFVAWYGANEGFPSWDQLYWQGEHKFKVESGQTVEAPVVIKLGVVQVSVSFDAASFDKYYSTYSADVRTTTPKTPDAGFLNFTPDDALASGHFLPGTLRLRLRLTDKRDGKEYLFSPADPVGAALGAEHYNMTLKVDETKGFTTLVVTTDNEVTEIAMDVHNLPASTLPKAPPRIRSLGFDYTDSAPIVHTQGIAPSEPLSAVIDASGGVRSIRLVACSEPMRAAWGGVDEIELVGVSTEHRRLLEWSGFVWPSVLDTPEQAAKATARLTIRFDDLFRKQGAQPEAGASGTDYSFRIEVEDLFGQGSTSTSTKFQPTLRILPPVFDWTAPTAGNVWAKHASFELTAAVEVAGGEPFVEYCPEGQTTWVRGTYERQALADGRWRYTITGLTPATAYRFRARMGAFTTPEFATTTETTPQMPNSDMEQWSWSKLGTKYSDIPYYSAWASGSDAFWATNNDRSTSYRTYGFFGTTYAYNCFPAVSYSVSSFEGKLAAEVRSVGGSGGAIATAGTKTAGALFTGRYSYPDSKDNYDYGQPWATRPAALQFYYTYDSYSEDKYKASVELFDAGGNLIGRGSFVSTSGSTTDYTLVTVPITYTAWPSRAAKIVVVFRSSTNEEPNLRPLKYKIDYFDGSGNNTGANEEWSTHTGSVLRVDGLKLVY